MGDPLKFQSMFQYYMFMAAFVAIVVLEGAIVISTHQKAKAVKKRDKGTRWLLIGCYVICIYASVFFVSHMVPENIRKITFEGWTAWVGIVMIWVGIGIRLIAVRTLKKGFTVNVQTTDSQDLITNGIYKKVRNPSYTGSILSLLGVAAAFRSVVAIAFVLMISVGCYWMRIRTEERAMEEQFGRKYEEYEKRSYRLVPYVW